MKKGFRVMKTHLGQAGRRRALQCDAEAGSGRMDRNHQAEMLEGCGGQPRPRKRVKTQHCGARVSGNSKWRCCSWSIWCVK